MELEEAMKLQMNAFYAHAHRTQHGKSEYNREFKYKDKIKILRDDIIAYIQLQYGIEDVFRVPAKFLVQAISVIKGSEDRTIKRYLKLLKENNYIKESGSAEVEFIYEQEKT